MAKKTDSRIKKYEDSKGRTRYMFQVYIGTDPITGVSRKTKRRGFETIKSAEQALARIDLNVSKGEFVVQKQDNTIKTIEDLGALWLPIYETTVKVATYASTKKILENHVYPAFKGVRLNKLDVPTCQRKINEWADKQPKTFKKYKFYTSKLLDYAVSIELINDNPMKKTIMPKIQHEKKDVPFYSKEELKQFLGYAKEFDEGRAYTFFRILAYTGLRKGEAFALTWEDIDFTDSVLSVNKTIARGINSKLTINRPKTKKSFRTISLDAETLSILRSWKKQQKINQMKLGHPVTKDNQLIFCSQENTLLNATRDRGWLEHIYKRAPKDFKRISSHGFRHTHASLLFEAGATIKEVQDRLGHSDISTTMNIYTHVTEAIKEQVADKFSAYMAN